jgi:hypothetical protein
MSFTTPNGHVVPSPSDSPARAAFENLANSINDNLRFNNLNQANDWVHFNPNYATHGRTAVINGNLHILSRNGVTIWNPIPITAHTVRFLQATSAGNAASTSANDPHNVYWVAA